ASIPESDTLFYRCELCFRAFRKKVVLRLHIKAKHAAEYNAKIITQRVKPRWEREETYLLAKAEVQLGKILNINQKLHERFPERSFDSIKSHGRRPGGGRAISRSQRRQSRALAEATGRGGSTAAWSEGAQLEEGSTAASSQGAQLQEGEGDHRTLSREALLRALREAVEKEPPRKFQGQRLWDVAREAISGGDVLRPVNDYIWDVFFLDQRRMPPQGSKPASPRESRRRRRRREYARTQELFHKRPADCAREVLDGPAEAGVEDIRGFFATSAGIMTGPPHLH
ncbi:unnamed protein product, partial [Ixodes persulcatus]